MPHKVLLDESGDLGWTFTYPYRNGGSSRFLTIGHIVVPESLHHLPVRLVKKVYKKFSFPIGTEIKGTHLTDGQRRYVCTALAQLVKDNPDIKLGAITVKKANVQTHIQQDGNLLYNYMIKLSVLDKVKHRPSIKLHRDERTIKVASGNSCIEYLQTTLWFEMNSLAQLIDKPTKSHTDLNIILVDWLTNIIWRSYEDQDAAPRNILLRERAIDNRKLFF